MVTHWDLYAEGFPHGTPTGYVKGCRGAGCPEGVESGMSCARAKQLAAGDYRYRKLAAAGMTPAEIAKALDEQPTTHEAPKPRPAVPDDIDDDVDEDEQEPAMTTPSPATIIKSPQPTAPAPAAAATLTTAKYTEGLNQRQKSARLAEIREWCRTHGFPGIPTHGKIPNDALAAYDDAYEGEYRPITTQRPDDGIGLIGSVGHQDVVTALTDPAPDEDFAKRSDMLDETRARLQELNHEADTEPDLPEQLVAEIKVIEDRLSEAPTPRPDWADVKPGIDELTQALAEAEAARDRARDIAVHLEQENAQLDSALDFTLTKWDEAKTALAEAQDHHRQHLDNCILDKLIIHELTQRLDHAVKAGATTQYQLVTARLARKLVETDLAETRRQLENERAARPWWKRRR